MARRGLAVRPRLAPRPARRRGGDRLRPAGRVRPDAPRRRVRRVRHRPRGAGRAVVPPGGVRTARPARPGRGRGGMRVAAPRRRRRRRAGPGRGGTGRRRHDRGRGVGVGALRRRDRPVVLRPAARAIGGAQLAAAPARRMARLRAAVAGLLPGLGGGGAPARGRGHRGRTRRAVRPAVPRRRAVFLRRPGGCQRGRTSRPRSTPGRSSRAGSLTSAAGAPSHATGLAVPEQGRPRPGSCGMARNVPGSRRDPPATSATRHPPVAAQDPLAGVQRGQFSYIRDPSAKAPRKATQADPCRAPAGPCKNSHGPARRRPAGTLPGRRPA